MTKRPMGRLLQPLRGVSAHRRFEERHVTSRVKEDQGILFRRLNRLCRQFPRGQNSEFTKHGTYQTEVSKTSQLRT